MKNLKNKYPNPMDIVMRYVVLLIIAVPNLWVFYAIFTPLTLYVLSFVLKLFFEVSVINNTLVLNSQFPIEIVEACVAGAAYYLLLILNLSVSGIKLKKRLAMIFSSFAFLFVINILRIILLSIIYVKGYSFFDAAHWILWHLMSIVFVVGIWFAEVRLFKIKEIPVYSDIKFLVSNIKKAKRRIKRKR